MTITTDPNAPLILADGTKIDPANGKVIKDQPPKQFIEIPSGSQAQAIVAKARRSINELPLLPQNMNAVSLVLFYSMWGLSDIDTSVATGMSIDQIKRIKKLPQYDTLSSDIVRAVLEHEGNSIRTYFQKKATAAAEKVVNTMEEGGAVLGFKAAQDILDRAGHRPADVVEHRHSMQDALRIEHIIKEDSSQLPTINITEYEVL